MAKTLSEEKYEIATQSDCRGSQQLIRTTQENAREMENERQCVIDINSEYAQVGTGNKISFASSILKANPVLQVIKNIPSPVNLGRGRRDFPDEQKDYAVHLLAFKDPNTIERIDCNFGDRRGFEREGDYSIDVVDIKRESSQETDANRPDCLWKQSCKKTGSPGFAAFWFRFFEPNTEYRITFALRKIVQNQAKSKKRQTLHETTVVVRTKPSKSKSVRKRSARKDDNKSIVLFNLPPAAPSERSLELTEMSNHVMKLLQFPRDNGRWEEFTEVSRELSVQFPNLDTRLTILLEESVMKCYLNRMDESKALIEEALSQVPQAVNSSMLMGRAYHYLAGVYRREKSLGEAEKCVQLAAQNFHGSAVSLDQSFLAYERASVLFDFCFCFPSVSPKLVKQAKDDLKKCIAFCTQLEEMAENGGQQLYVKKHHFAFIKIAMLLLNCRNKAAREQHVSDDHINTARESLQALETKYKHRMATGEKVQFYLARSDLEYRLQNYQNAERFANEALEISQLFSFNTEIKSARERLEHIRQKLRQFHLPGDNGNESDSAFTEPVTSSSSNGQDADVSCTDSDWLPGNESDSAFTEPVTSSPRTVR